VSAPAIEFGATTQAIAGQPQSGDLYLVQEFPGGILVAAVDGLGHGKEAATAAAIAVATLESHAPEPVAELVRRCHEELLATRGVVMSLASFRAADQTMTWLGVGNVEGLLLRAAPQEDGPDEPLLLRRGVVGDRLPAVLRPSLLRVGPGDTLVLATDGIESGFPRTMHRGDPPQRIADRILAQHSKGTDDALVLVARYVGCRV
jgi:hypothetical protein